MLLTLSTLRPAFGWAAIPQLALDEPAQQGLAELAPRAGPSIRRGAPMSSSPRARPAAPKASRSRRARWSITPAPPSRPSA
ncbi:hypothetical protein QWZ10_03760 [Paracoccus cavernae]|uniref:Uncharacterized protein n=1 Tax=Paracoccus cavernae TaxID=1571207 RepID=A0ABT8D5Q9_9RHOB|nr:hypothetical protein [Paracoccus cavernae]